MKERYFLKEKDSDKKTGYIVGMIEIDEYNHAYVDGECYEFNSWDGYSGKPIFEEKQFLADFHCKWDSCTHWNFRGEDFDPEMKDCEEDNYYHLCGCRSFTNHIRLMCFVWKVVAAVLVRENKDSDIVDNSKYIMEEAYFETDTIKVLVEYLLKDYEILKEE